MFGFGAKSKRIEELRLENAGLKKEIAGLNILLESRADQLAQAESAASELYDKTKELDELEAEHELIKSRLSDAIEKSELLQKGFDIVVDQLIIKNHENGIHVEYLTVIRASLEHIRQVEANCSAELQKPYHITEDHRQQVIDTVFANVAYDLSSREIEEVESDMNEDYKPEPVNIPVG